MVTNSFSSILSSISNNLAENLIIPQLINKILNIEEEKWGISYKYLFDTTSVVDPDPMAF